ncbi:MAG: galactosyltransferase-related protein [bacterium]
MSNDLRIGLLVHAIHLPKERLRLKASFDELPARLRTRVELCILTEDDYDDNPAQFNVAAAKNVGLRKLLPRCDGVLCVDADYLIPPGLLELCLEPSMQAFHLWVRRRDITEAEAPKRAWADWLNLPVFQDCWGSANYLSSDNWRKIGGWDERTYGWGGDDDILHIRIGQAGIERRRIDAIPLVHVGHALREWSGVNARGKENLKWASVPQPNYL